MTFDEAVKIVTDHVASRLHAGEAFGCPVCDTNLKIYKRGLNAGMVRGMLLLYVLQKKSSIPGGWVVISKDDMSRDMCLLLHHYEYEKLPWWGLAEKECDRNDMAGVKGGSWRLTTKGIDFLTKGTSVRKHVYELLSHPIKIEDEKPSYTTAKKALRKDFSLPELLADSLDSVVARIKAA